MTAAQVTDWSPYKEVADPKDTSVTINISGNPHYGFNRGWVKKGRTSDGMRDLSSTEIYFLKDGFWGRLSIADGLGGTYFYENTASKNVKTFGYWRDKNVDPSNNGSFNFQSVVLRWISFPHKTPQGKDAECASFFGAGRGSRFAISAYWCTEGGRQMSEADVRKFVEAVGYKDLFTPRPMDRPPGR